MPDVYLLCLSRPYRAQTGKMTKTARHYVGASRDCRQRIAAHRSGHSGSRLMQVAHAAGITFTVARAWSFTRKDEAFRFERHLKAMKQARSFCPCCTDRPRDPLDTWTGSRPVRKRVSLLNALGAGPALPPPSPASRRAARRRAQQAGLPVIAPAVVPVETVPDDDDHLAYSYPPDFGHDHADDADDGVPANLPAVTGCDDHDDLDLPF